jgi:hypothetical protein
VSAGAQTSFAIPDPGCESGDWHPMGLGKRRGTIYVGGTCGGEETVSVTSPIGDPSKVTGHVFAFNGSTFTPVFSFPLDYQRGCAFRDNSSPATSCDDTRTVGQLLAAEWQAWNTTAQLIGAESFASGPQPMLSNIEFDLDGNMIIGLHDRFGDQGGNHTPQLGTGTPQMAFGAGDVLLACVLGSTYQLESDGSCGTKSGTGGIGEGPGSAGGEFYDDHWVDLNSFRYSHSEITQGGLAVLPGGQLYVTAMDPGFSAWRQGVIGLSNADGTHSSGYELQVSLGDETFGKGNGLADLELLCDQAPVQVGNRVWHDLDSDGIQDAGEPSIAGVTVRLYDAAGVEVVGSAITDSNGEYSFATDVAEPADGGSTPDAIGGGLVVDQDMTIRIDNMADYMSGPIGTLALMVANATTPLTTDNDDAIDSDAVLVGGTIYGVDRFPSIVLLARGPGMNSHKLDFGFGLAPPPPPPQPTSTVTTAPVMSSVATVTGRVFIDSNGNGIADAGESPVGGVTVALTTETSRQTTVTDANGSYRFDDVPLGDATIEIIGSNGRPATGRSQTVSVSGRVNEDFPITAIEAEQLRSRQAGLPATGTDPRRLSLVAMMMLAAGVAMTSRGSGRRKGPS